MSEVGMSEFWIAYMDIIEVFDDVAYWKNDNFNEIYKRRIFP